MTYNVSSGTLSLYTTTTDIWLSRILWNKQHPAETSKIYSSSYNRFDWQ